MATSPQQHAIVEGIVRLARTLGLQVVAEGIERPATGTCWSRMGCRLRAGLSVLPPVERRRRDAVAADDASALTGDVARRPELTATGTRARRAAAAGTTAATTIHAGTLESCGPSTRMYDAVIDEIDGRRIRVGDHWLVDLASCNYLGFDLDAEIIDASTTRCARWGTHPSWSRHARQPAAVPARSRSGSTELLGARTRWCCRHHPDPPVGDPGPRRPGHGAPRRPGPQDDLRRLRARPRARRHPAPVPHRRPRRAGGPAAAAAGRRSAAGVHGRRQQHDRQRARPGRPTPALPRVRRHCCTSTTRTASASSASGGPTRHPVRVAGQLRSCATAARRYDNIVLVGGFSKAYSSLLAFLAVPTAAEGPAQGRRRRRTSTPDRRRPPRWPRVLAGFDVNADRGDELRADLYRMTDAGARPRPGARRGHAQH